MKKIKIINLIIPFLLATSLWGFREISHRRENIDYNAVKQALVKYENPDQKDFKESSIEINSLENFPIAHNTDQSPSISDEYTNWAKYNIKGIGSILIPPTLELRKDSSIVANIANDIKEKYEKIFNIGELKSKVIFQPVGMNAFKKGAINLYSRVLIDIDRGKNGDFYSNLQLKKLSREQLSEINEVYKKNTFLMFEKTDNRILEWSPIKVESTNGTSYLKIEYLRQAGENPPVKVILYAIHNNNEMIRINISYRETERNYWEHDFEKIIGNFIINKIN